MNSILRKQLDLLNNRDKLVDGKLSANNKESLVNYLLS